MKLIARSKEVTTRYGTEVYVSSEAGLFRFPRSMHADTQIYV